MCPQLLLRKQDSLAVENYSKNGTQKELYTIAKNFPFTLEISTNGTFNLAKTTVNAKLLYDIDDPSLPDKEVEAVKQNRLLDWKTFKSATGDSAVLECRIHCLSSQHSTFFRVKLQVKDPDSEEVLTVSSHAIRVVSKASQIRRKLAKQQACAVLEQETTKATAPLKRPRDFAEESDSDNELATPPPKAFPTPVSTDRPPHDDIVSRLLKLQQESHQQADLLRHLVAGKSTPSGSALDVSELELGRALASMLLSFKNLPSEEKRSAKIRKVTQQLSVKQYEEFINFINYASMAGAPSSPPSTELERLLDTEWDTDMQSFLVPELTM